MTGAGIREEAVIAALLEGARAGGAVCDGAAAGPLVRGPGDDAACLRPPPGVELVWTVDDLVEGRHFRRPWASWEQVGRKAAAVCLSDLAASGALPLGLLLAAGIPADVGLEDLRRLGRGLGERLAASGCPLAGGNVYGDPDRLTLSVSALGQAPLGRSLGRAAARPGDLLYVSGSLGWARAGLLWLDGGGDPDPADPEVTRAVARLLDPVPRFDLAPLLVAPDAPALAAMDLSDGLARDLPRLARRSGLRAVVDTARLPAPPAGVADRVGASPAELAWVGGEDYELLVAGPPDLPPGLAGELTVVGRLEAGAPGEVVLEGPLAQWRGEGWDHFGR